MRNTSTVLTSTTGKLELDQWLKLCKKSKDLLRDRSELIAEAKQIVELSGRGGWITEPEGGAKRRPTATRTGSRISGWRGHKT